MNRLAKLRTRRQAVTDEMAAMSAVLEKEDRLAFTEDEQKAYAALESEATGLDAEIEREARLDARVQAQSQSAGRVSHAGASAPIAEGNTVTTNANQVITVRERIADDPRRGFACMGDFAMSIYQAGIPGTAIDRRLAATGMSQSIGSDGGFLVPPEFSTAIWEGVNQASDSLLARTDNYTVTGESLTFNANAETSRATGSRWGGVRAYWIAEAGQMTSSKPKLRQMKLEPKELAVMCYATDKLLRNATAVEQWITRAAADEINFLVGDAIIEGDGAGKPLGIINAGCKVEVAKETGQAAKTVVTENIVKMWARLHARSRGNAVWFINQDVEPQLLTMTLGVGTGGGIVYMPPGGLSASPYATLLGRPVLPIEYCATLGTAGDIILADLGAYATGTQGGVNSAMSIHLKFDYNETAFRFIFAVDGQPWLASAITPFKGSNTVSPFITLATRA